MDFLKQLVLAKKLMTYAKFMILSYFVEARNQLPIAWSSVFDKIQKDAKKEGIYLSLDSYSPEQHVVRVALDKETLDSSGADVDAEMALEALQKYLTTDPATEPWRELAKQLGVDLNGIAVGATVVTADDDPIGPGTHAPAPEADLRKKLLFKFNISPANADALQDAFRKFLVRLSAAGMHILSNLAQYSEPVEEEGVRGPYGEKGPGKIAEVSRFISQLGDEAENKIRDADSAEERALVLSVWKQMAGEKTAEMTQQIASMSESILEKLNGALKALFGATDPMSVDSLLSTFKMDIKKDKNGQVVHKKTGTDLKEKLKAAIKDKPALQKAGLQRQGVQQLIDTLTDIEDWKDAQSTIADHISGAEQTLNQLVNQLKMNDKKKSQELLKQEQDEVNKRLKKSATNLKLERDVWPPRPGKQEEEADSPSPELDAKYAKMLDEHTVEEILGLLKNLDKQRASIENKGDASPKDAKQLNIIKHVRDVTKAVLEEKKIAMQKRLQDLKEAKKRLDVKQGEKPTEAPAPSAPAATPAAPAKQQMNLF